MSNRGSNRDATALGQRHRRFEPQREPDLIAVVWAERADTSLGRCWGCRGLVRRASAHSSVPWRGRMLGRFGQPAATWARAPLAWRRVRSNPVTPAAARCSTLALPASRIAIVIVPWVRYSIVDGLRSIHSSSPRNAITGSTVFACTCARSCTAGSLWREPNGRLLSEVASEPASII